MVQLHSATSLVAYSISMKLIFLDIDGVFCTGKHFIALHEQKILRHNKAFDPVAVEQFNRILKETGAQVVISSTWRKFMSIVELKDWFEKSGIPNIPIIGKTVDFAHGIRGREIQVYLENMKEKPEKFCIIDDDADMEHLMPYLIKTDFDNGITPEIADKVIQFLNG